MDYKVVNQLTKEEAVELHKELWNTMIEIAESGIFPFKEDALDRMGYSTKDVTGDCFLCVYGSQQLNKFMMHCNPDNTTRPFYRPDKPIQCDWCPLKWMSDTDDAVSCMISKSPFEDYLMLIQKYRDDEVDEQVLADVIKACKVIRDLPVREN